LYTYMYTHPGGKLLFMGNEFAQTTEWNYKSELSWELLEFDCHKMMQECVRDLNHLYKDEPAMHELQFDMGGFEWIDLHHRAESVIAFRRKGKKKADDMLVILNMTPVVRQDWTIRVKGKASWKEVFNSDLKKYWGTGDVYNPSPEVKLVDKKNQIFEIKVQLPALGGLIFK
jgi:1,4-alpha-glucan branching enzyme